MGTVLRGTKTRAMETMASMKFQASLGDIDFFHSRMIALETINTGMDPSPSIPKNRQCLAERQVQSRHSPVHNGHWQIRLIKFNRLAF